jgi:splicing factor U2AF subunit
MQVLLLKNIVTREELADDGEFEDIQEDVKGECSTYGIIESIIIPRERDGFRASAEGSIYVMYQNADMARAASAALSGRKFANRIVSVEYVRISVCNIFIVHVLIYVVHYIFADTV